MAAKDHLISLGDRTLEERREIGRRGGIASAKKRHERRTLREELLLLLEDEDKQKSLTVALFKKALDGDTKAYEVIRDTIGEKPKDVVAVENNVIKVTIDD